MLGRFPKGEFYSRDPSAASQGERGRKKEKKRNPPGYEQRIQDRKQEPTSALISSSALDYNLDQLLK